LRADVGNRIDILNSRKSDCELDVWVGGLLEKRPFFSSGPFTTVDLRG